MHLHGTRQHGTACSGPSLHGLVQDVHAPRRPTPPPPSPALCLLLLPQDFFPDYYDDSLELMLK